MRQHLAILLFIIPALAFAQRPYLFDNISDAASASLIGVGATIQTLGYNSAGDGGGATYVMTKIANAPFAADSGYVYPVNASKVLVQVLQDEFLRSATYGIVCGDSSEASNNFTKLQRYFNAINALDKQAFINGCNDTLYVDFTSALTLTLTSHDQFVMIGEGSDITKIKATTGVIDFGFSDAAKVNLFDMYLDGYDATAFGGIGGGDQLLTYTNDTLRISGGNYVVITGGGGGGGTDDQTISIDSNSTTYTLAIESGNSVAFAKVTDTDTDDQTLSFSSPNLSISEGNTVDLSALQDGTGTDDQTITLDSTATSYTATVEDGGSITWAKFTDTDTDDQILSIDSTSSKYTIAISDGNSIEFGKGILNEVDGSVTNELQAITIDSVSGAYNLTLSDGGGTVKIKRDTDTDAQTLSFSSPNLSILNGNTVDLSALQDGTGTDDQTISIDSNATTYTLSIESGNSVNFAKAPTGTDDQTLTIDSASISATARKFTVSIESGNSITFVDSIGSGGGGTPAGSTGEIQFNNAGSFAASSDFVWDIADAELQVGVSDAGDYDIQSGNGLYLSGRIQYTSASTNTFAGYNAGVNNISGTANTAFGYRALEDNTIRSNSTAIGYLAASNYTGFGFVTAIGTQAADNITGGGNSWFAMGYQAARQSNGNGFVSIGNSSAYSHSSGDHWTAIGQQAAYSMTTSQRFIAIGHQSGRYVGAGTANGLQNSDESIYIGYEARAGQDSIDNEIVIGANAIGNGTNTATIGNTSTTDVYLNGTTHSNGAYIGKVTTFNSSSGQTTYGTYICQVAYTSTGAATLTIDSDNAVQGYTLIIKDADGNAGSNTITIDTEGAETIDGAASITITTNYGAVRLYCDGTNWFTF